MTYHAQKDWDFHKTSELSLTSSRESMLTVHFISVLRLSILLKKYISKEMSQCPFERALMYINSHWIILRIKVFNLFIK